MEKWRKQFFAVTALTLGTVIWPITDRFFPRRALVHDRDLAPELEVERTERERAPIAIECGKTVTSSATGPVAVLLSCTATTAESALAIAQDLSAYFSAPAYLYLRPPWEPGFTPTAEQMNARVTFWHEMSGSRFARPGHDITPPKLEARDAEVTRMFRELRGPKTLTIAAELGARMGQLPLELAAHGQLRPKDDRDIAFGHVELRGSRLTIDAMIAHGESGLPDIVTNLCARGCDRDVSYELGYDNPDD